jgi:fumarate hydratase class II
MADNTGVKYRQEHDSLGRVTIPEDAYYGAQTARARKNFIESGLKPPSEFIYALALIKRFAAVVNRSLAYLEPESAAAIITSATEVMEGKFEREFVVDLFQTGSGTSTNINMN